MIKSLMILGIWMCSCSGVFAGYVLLEEQLNNTMGQVTRFDVTTYVSKDAIRVIEPEVDTLIRINSQSGKVEIFSIDNNARAYTDMSNMAIMLLFGQMAFADCTQQPCRPYKDALLPNGDDQIIGPWGAAKGFNVKIQALFEEEKIQSSAWLIRSNQDLINAEKMRFEFLFRALKKIGIDSELLRRHIDSIHKQYGAVVRMKVNISMGETITSLKSISSKDLNEDVFSIPEGYKQGMAMPGFPIGGSEMPNFMIE